MRSHTLTIIAIFAFSLLAASFSHAQEANNADSAAIKISESKIKQKGLVALPKSKTSLVKQRLVQQHSSIYGDFDIHTSTIELFDDLDNDQHYSSLRLSFDVDTIYSSADIQAFVYIRTAGHEWQTLLDTDTYTIYGDSSDDVISIETQLHSGFNADYYDIMVEVYDIDEQVVVAELDSTHNWQLDNLALESIDYEQEQIELPVVDALTIDLHSDNDGDGYYQALDLSLNMQAVFDPQDYMIRVSLLRDGNWLTLLDSDLNYYTDSWRVSLPRLLHYGLYEMKIDFYHLDTQRLALSETSLRWSGLKNLPLEDANDDQTIRSEHIVTETVYVEETHYDSTSHIDTEVTYSEHSDTSSTYISVSESSHGGSTGTFIMLLITTVLVLRKLQKGTFKSNRA